MSLQPVNIHLESIGKKFGSEWIFRNIDLTFPTKEKVVILGGNGSGKSTLLQIIAGYVVPNKGKTLFKNDEKRIDPERIKDHISLASPYLEVIEEFSLSELIDHCSFYKPFLSGLDTKKIIEISGLSHAGSKAIGTYSSGMRQRVKLTLAILANCPVLLLDEPTSNFDKNAIGWYKQMITEYAMSKTILVCSNSVKDEFDFCTRQIDLADYK